MEEEYNPNNTICRCKRGDRGEAVHNIRSEHGVERRAQTWVPSSEHICRMSRIPSIQRPYGLLES